MFGGLLGRAFERLAVPVDGEVGAVEAAHVAAVADLGLREVRRVVPLRVVALVELERAERTELDAEAAALADLVLDHHHAAEVLLLLRRGLGAFSHVCCSWGSVLPELEGLVGEARSLLRAPVVKHGSRSRSSRFLAKTKGDFIDPTYRPIADLGTPQCSK